VVDRASLEIGVGSAGSAANSVESGLGFIGASGEEPGEASSGFAMRRPPKD